MNKLVSLVLCVFLLNGYFSGQSKLFTLIPDILSALLLLVMLARIAIDRNIALSPKYIVLGIFVFLHIMAGILVNQVSPGAIISGARVDFKWIPIFLIPVVYQFTDDEIKIQLRLVLCLLILQLPVSFYQRFFQYRYYGTGDVITGTLGKGGSGALSILLLSGIAVLLAFYFRKKMGFKKALLLSVILFVPTTINETKVTLILLPLVLIIPYIAASEGRVAIGKLFGISVLGLSLTLTFIVIYDQIADLVGRETLQTFVDKQADTYLYKGGRDDRGDILKKNLLGENILLPSASNDGSVEMKRVDQIKLAINTLSDDPTKLMLGLGVGNVTASSFNVFSGEYAWSIGNLGTWTLISIVLWESGILGTIFLIIFLLFIAVDTWKVSRKNTYISAFAAGWFAIVLVFIITMPYLNVMYFNALMFGFSYYSGIMISERRRQELLC